MYIPSSTYRLQFNKSFTFSDLRKNLPYFQLLDPGAIYASPVFQAVPGSNHGYDVTDPLSLNKEIGTSGEFKTIVSGLKKLHIGWIQDIVPNHMAFHTQNTWLMDVFKNGPGSKYSGFFDIDWNHPDFRNKIMAPFLGHDLNEVISRGEIRMSQDQDGYFLHYGDSRIPVNERSVVDLIKLSHAGDKDICELVNEHPEWMLKLHSNQHYILCCWQDSGKRLNYRRFFTINGLISMCMEKEEVFRQYHAMIFQWIQDGLIDGLRIDHIDGLKHPGNYFNRLRSSAGEGVFIVAEKILEHNEGFIKSWPVQGTTGYEFLSLVNNLFSTSVQLPLLSELYRKTCSISESAEEYSINCKRNIIKESFRGDMDNLARIVITSGLIVIDPDQQGIVREAIEEFLIYCPVYKLYSDTFPLKAEDQAIVENIFRKAVSERPRLSKSVDFLKNILFNDWESLEKKAVALEFFLKLMQYSGPVMAKGIEDTAMYGWSAFIAHNEVGDRIDASGISISDFHDAMEERRKWFPLALNATATHDTKRGEDARARLNVISDIPKMWKPFVHNSMKTNFRFKTEIGEQLIPDLNEEYFIYQSLLGAVPMNGIPDKQFRNRFDEYITKALREAKVHSNWNNPDMEYENAVKEFVHNILDDKHFMLDLFRPVFQVIMTNGMLNSLSQVVLKCTCPGIPDIYQGTELWDLSLVDPDNRRPVDYSLRFNYLKKLKDFEDHGSILKNLWRTREDGRIKLWFIHRLIHERASDPANFTDSDYIPLVVKGMYRNNIIAFARKNKQLWFLTIVPLHQSMIAPSTEIKWKDTRIILPEGSPMEWELIWDNSRHFSKGEMIISEIPYSYGPWVFKGSNPVRKRSSGILLHISSLPGKFGIGGFGHEAFDFIDFLKKSGQVYWQILPCAPIDNSFSPYSSSSAFAGNTLFIDPLMLYEQGLISKLPDEISADSRVDYRRAKAIRGKVLMEAWNRFKTGENDLMHKKFEVFCTKNSYWLHDFVFFTLLQLEFSVPWQQWPLKLRNHDAASLDRFLKKNHEKGEYIRFVQFLFQDQFMKVRTCANGFGIKIIGDVPIYVSYESSDVWAHPELFSLDVNKKMKTIAGVPPDFFSKTGQLWNMPVYDWVNMEKQKFEWWKMRIRRNLQFCDVLRFDHFRGFSAYWEVPAGEKTARRGQWTKAPGDRFLSELKGEFPEMPFIAEDLGDIDEDVYKLRDRFSLPGMKVLQFAFDARMSDSVHVPHYHNSNSVVYTGTHDNNTIKGWFDSNDSADFRKRIHEYTGKRMSGKEVPWEFIRMALASVAETAMIPMQDILELDADARLNIPSRLKNNWIWKLQDIPGKTIMQKLRKLTALYGRI